MSSRKLNLDLKMLGYDVEQFFVDGKGFILVLNELDDETKGTWRVMTSSDGIKRGGGWIEGASTLRGHCTGFRYHRFDPKLDIDDTKIMSGKKIHAAAQKVADEMSTGKL